MISTYGTTGTHLAGKNIVAMDDLRAENHNFNTMACEQTFAWLSRHKKIMCAMNKCHFHFICKDLQIATLATPQARE